jgi:PAS domain-containing protein
MSLGRIQVPSQIEFRGLLEKLPAGAYTCDPEGLITYFNQCAARLWGREPKLNDPADRFCGSFKLFGTDGSPIAHNQCWMALALETDCEHNGQEIVIERPDGSRSTVLAHANPIHDESGKLLGAVNVLVDISDRIQGEEAAARLAAIVESSHDAIVSKTWRAAFCPGMPERNASLVTRRMKPLDNPSRSSFRRKGWPRKRPYWPGSPVASGSNTLRPCGSGKTAGASMSP